MKCQGETCPPLVETRREMGQNIRTVNVDASVIAEGWEWISVTLPPAVWDYSAIVDALVTENYPTDKMQAVVNNYLLDPNDEDVVAEFNEMQEWRKHAKAIAKELLESYP